jgi:hypothetical protein
MSAPVQPIVIPTSYVAVCRACEYENTFDWPSPSVECGGCGGLVVVSWPARDDPFGRLVNLCRELDMEMDGVACPRTAAAVFNAIRSVLSEMDDQSE